MLATDALKYLKSRSKSKVISISMNHENYNNNMFEWCEGLDMIKRIYKLGSFMRYEYMTGEIFLKLQNYIDDFKFE